MVRKYGGFVGYRNCKTAELADARFRGNVYKREDTNVKLGDQNIRNKSCYSPTRVYRGNRYSLGLNLQD